MRACLDRIHPEPATSRLRDAAVLVVRSEANRRITGLIVSATTSRGAAEKTIDELKKAVQLMDLAGLEKNDLEKPQPDGKTLAKYFPKLEPKK